MSLNWQAEKTKHGAPIAVLYDGKQRDVVKVYLSPDRAYIRFVLNEMIDLSQIKIDVKNKLIDFRREV